MPRDRPARNGERDFGCEARLRKRRTLNSFSLGLDAFSMMYWSIVALERAASLGKRCLVRSAF